MTACPVVRIKTPKGWAHINESDYDPDKHELVEGEVAPESYVSVEEFAEHMSAEETGEKGDQVEIPDDWEGLHWKKQVDLALQIIGGGGPLVPSEGQTQAEKAKAIIKSHLEG